MEIDVKITRLGAPDSNVKAYVSATIGNCFAVRGMKLVEGKNGLFLSMPNYQKKTSATQTCASPQRQNSDSSSTMRR